MLRFQQHSIALYSCINMQLNEMNERASERAEATQMLQKYCKI